MFLATAAQADLVLQSLWPDSGACQSSPPSSLVLFDDSVASTPFYDFMLQDYSIGICGYAPTSTQAQACCYSALNSPQSPVAGSASFWYASGDLATEELPASAAGSVYARLEALEGTALGAWRSLSVHCDGTCTFGVTCHLSGPLANVSIYLDKGCNVLDKSPVLLAHDDTRVRNDTAVGAVAISLFVPSAEQSRAAFWWTALSPNILLLQNTHHWADIVANSFLAFSLVATLVLLYLYTKEHMKRKTAISLLDCINQSLWASFIVGWIILSTNPMTLENVYITDEIAVIFFNLATLLSVQQTNAVLLKISGVKLMWVHVLVYTLFTVAHFVICFPSYLIYMMTTLPSSGFIHLLYLWFQGRDAWVWLMFIYVLFPNTYMVVSLTAARLKKKDNISTPSMIFNNLRRDTILIVLTCLHISNFLFFVFIWLSLFFLYWPGNDRVGYSLYSWKALAITMHFWLQYASRLHLQSMYKRNTAPSPLPRLHRHNSLGAEARPNCDALPEQSRTPHIIVIPQSKQDETFIEVDDSLASPIHSSFLPGSSYRKTTLPLETHQEMSVISFGYVPTQFATQEKDGTSVISLAISYSEVEQSSPGTATTTL
ncbi:hypothetical protein HDU91_005806 [Kappamyces sp. JEL0680]|nr:hypothetical protein HDU91_005806 [Kappamyces sp. JEL0680]